MEYSTSFKHGKSADLSQKLLSTAPTVQALGIQGLVNIIKEKKNNSLTNEAKQILIDSVCDGGVDFKRSVVSALSFLKETGCFEVEQIVNELTVRVEKDPFNVIKALLVFRKDCGEVLQRLIPRFGSIFLQILLTDQSIDTTLILRVLFNDELPEAEKILCVHQILERGELRSLVDAIACCHKSMALRKIVFSSPQKTDPLFCDTLFQDDPWFVLGRRGFTPRSLDITTVSCNFIRFPEEMATVTPSPLLYGSVVEAGIVLGDAYKLMDDPSMKATAKSLDPFSKRIDFKRESLHSAGENESLEKFLENVFTAGGESDYLQGWLESCEREQDNSMQHRPAVSALLGILPILSIEDQNTAFKILGKYIEDIQYRSMCFYTLMMLQLGQKIQNPEAMNFMVKCAYLENAPTVGNYLLTNSVAGKQRSPETDRRLLQALGLSVSICEKYPRIALVHFEKLMNYEFRKGSEEKMSILVKMAEALIENHSDCSSEIMPMADALLGTREDFRVAAGVKISASLIGKGYLDFHGTRKLIRDKANKFSEQNALTLAAFAELLGTSMESEDGEEEILSVYDELWEMRFAEKEVVANSVWNALASLFERGLISPTDLKLPVVEILQEVKLNVESGICGKVAVKGISHFLRTLIALDLPSVQTPAYTKDSSFSTTSFSFCSSILYKISKEPSWEREQRLRLFPYEVRERFQSIAHAQNRDKILTEFYRKLSVLMKEIPAPDDIPGCILFMAQWRASVSSLLDTSSLEKSGLKRIDVFLSGVQALLKLLAEENHGPGYLCALNGLIMEIVDVARKTQSSGLSLDLPVSLLKSVLDELLKKEPNLVATCSWALNGILQLNSTQLLLDPKNLQPSDSVTSGYFTVHSEIKETIDLLKSEKLLQGGRVYKEWIYPICAAFGFDPLFANFVDSLADNTSLGGLEIANKLKKLRDSKDHSKEQLESEIIDLVRQCTSLGKREFFEIVDADLKRILQKHQSDALIREVSKLSTLCWGFDLLSNVNTDFRQMPRDRTIFVMIRFLFENCGGAKDGLLLNSLVDAFSPQKRPDGRTLPPFYWQKLFDLAKVGEISIPEIKKATEISFFRLALQEQVSSIILALSTKISADDLLSLFLSNPSSFLNNLSFSHAQSLLSSLFDSHAQQIIDELDESQRTVLSHPVVTSVLLSRLPKMDCFDASVAMNPLLKFNMGCYRTFVNRISKIYDFWLFCKDLNLGEYEMEPVQKIVETMHNSDGHQRAVMMRIWGQHFTGRAPSQIYYAMASLLDIHEKDGVNEQIVFLLFCALLVSLPQVFPMKWLGKEDVSAVLLNRVRRSWIIYIRNDEGYKRLHEKISSFLMRILALDVTNLDPQQLSQLKFMLLSAFGRHGVPQKVIKETPTALWKKLL